MAIERFLGTYSLRPLQKGEVYSCNNGCGECKKVLKEEDNRTVHDREGQLLERHYSKAEVSSCCNDGISIWNDETDEEVATEYEFTPSEKE